MSVPSVRVAIDSQIFCSQTYGGVSRYFTRLALELIAQQQQVCVFAPVHRNAYLDELPPNYRKGWRLPYCPSGTKRVLRPINRILSSGSIRRWKPEVIHESYYGKRGSGAENIPVVVTVHDMVHELFPESFSKLDNTSQLKRAAVERADHVICISENTRRDLLELWGVSGKKVSVVYHGYDPLPEPILQPEYLTAGKPYILYVANRNSYKNFSRLLQAYSMSPGLMRDYRIVVFGGGRLRNSEKSMISALGISADDVSQIGGPDEILASAYRCASVFVYPSLYEGFGLSPLEAMSLGCPVISSNASCMPEVLGAAVEYFDPVNAEQLGDALQAVLYDSARANELRGLGYKQVAQYSWSSCASSTVSIYSSLVDGG